MEILFPLRVCPEAPDGSAVRLFGADPTDSIASKRSGHRGWRRPIDWRVGRSIGVGGRRWRSTSEPFCFESGGSQGKLGIIDINNDKLDEKSVDQEKKPKGLQAGTALGLFTTETGIT